MGFAWVSLLSWRESGDKCEEIRERPELEDSRKE
jgi:hypothetical protein